MKKTCFLLIFAFISSMLLSACESMHGSNIVKTERRLGKYLQGGSTTTEKKSSGMIDLSEGPKLNYDAHFGPQNLNFDIKIVNPY